MGEYNFKFRVAKNVGSLSEETFGKVGTIIEVKDGKFKTEREFEFNNRLKFYKNIQEVKFHFSADDLYKTEFELVPEQDETTEQEMSAKEFIELYREFNSDTTICDGKKYCEGCDFKSCCTPITDEDVSPTDLISGLLKYKQSKSFEFRRQQALSKLTDEEIELLGLKES